ncbi:HCLS1-associated protein X-1 [Tribolium castaneum]|uniref:Uncharacterized protein n=1 Tax=Tribolium castaneum TaxID=7070 RepID=D6WLV2_TRICA|nr:PREDICTED: HCLS1-associated protein X-1 [Tribolium castaneum]EFA03397.1 hypothetical protein TcasGA2_TC013383 [Tribolium castaneum]|eukprot:XP_008193851.1 PREDICTED: HCLS1-associated protein X-1 [Tribolium castaneum]
MEFYDKVKRFLGFSSRQESPQFDERDRSWPEPPSRDEGFGAPFQSFSMFSDPFEMHKYFEQQMSEMLRNFGFHEFGDGFNHSFDLPQLEIEEIPDDEGAPKSGTLRDQFLKPGFEKPKERIEEKRDEDIDGRLDIRDWGSVFKGENSQTPVPRTRFFGQSVTSKTVRNPDGSIETHHTVRDNEGNEETTITRKVADKEYTITKRRDKEGKEEIIENLVNLDENEKDKFFPQQRKLPELGNKPWPFFDQFFK